MNSFFLLGFLRLCQFWWKSIKKCDRESARRRTDTLTDWQTDANRFYNLSHAICYSYGTDKNKYTIANVILQHTWCSLYRVFVICVFLIHDWRHLIYSNSSRELDGKLRVNHSLVLVGTVLITQTLINSINIWIGAMPPGPLATAICFN